MASEGMLRASIILSREIVLTLPNAVEELTCEPMGLSLAGSKQGNSALRLSGLFNDSFIGDPGAGVIFLRELVPVLFAVEAVSSPILASGDVAIITVAVFMAFECVLRAVSLLVLADPIFVLRDVVVSLFAEPVAGVFAD